MQERILVLGVNLNLSLKLKKNNLSDNAHIKYSGLQMIVTSYYQIYSILQIRKVISSRTFHIWMFSNIGSILGNFVFRRNVIISILSMLNFYQSKGGMEGRFIKSYW